MGWLIKTTSSVPVEPSLSVTGIEPTAHAFTPGVAMLIEPRFFQFRPPSRDK